MTDTDSSGAQTSPSGQVSSETLSGLELGWREGSRVRRGGGGAGVNGLASSWQHVNNGSDHIK